MMEPYVLAQILRKENQEKMLLFPINVIEGKYDWREFYSNQMKKHNENNWNQVKNFIGPKSEILKKYDTFYERIHGEQFADDFALRPPNFYKL